MRWLVLKCSLLIIFDCFGVFSLVLNLSFVFLVVFIFVGGWVVVIWLFKDIVFNVFIFFVVGKDLEVFCFVFLIKIILFVFLINFLLRVKLYFICFLSKICFVLVKIVFFIVSSWWVVRLICILLVLIIFWLNCIVILLIAEISCCCLLYFWWFAVIFIIFVGRGILRGCLFFVLFFEFWVWDFGFVVGNWVFFLFFFEFGVLVFLMGCLFWGRFGSFGVLFFLIVCFILNLDGISCFVWLKCFNIFLLLRLNEFVSWLFFGFFLESVYFEKFENEMDENIFFLFELIWFFRVEIFGVDDIFIFIGGLRLVEVVWIGLIFWVWLKFEVIWGNLYNIVFLNFFFKKVFFIDILIFFLIWLNFDIGFNWFWFRVDIFCFIFVIYWFIDCEGKVLIIGGSFGGGRG